MINTGILHTLAHSASENLLTFSGFLESTSVQALTALLSMQEGFRVLSNFSQILIHAAPQIFPDIKEKV